MVWSMSLTVSKVPEPLGAKQPHDRSSGLQQRIERHRGAVNEQPDLPQELLRGQAELGGQGLETLRHEGAHVS